MVSKTFEDATNITDRQLETLHNLLKDNVNLVKSVDELIKWLTTEGNFVNTQDVFKLSLAKTSVRLLTKYVEDVSYVATRQDIEIARMEEIGEIADRGPMRNVDAARAQHIKDMGSTKPSEDNTEEN